MNDSFTEFHDKPKSNGSWPAAAPPLTIKEWREREIPEPDFLMGEVFSTTSRGEIFAPTGLGKTMFCLALGTHMAAGLDFLHWRARRPCRVLYVDGEMSNRTMKRRLLQALNTISPDPEGFHLLSYHDVEKPASLSTPEGQAIIEGEIARMGGTDFMILDNRMSLIGGNMKETEAWQNTLPWALSLTRRSIGHLWVHHTGIDETHGYGDKTREWVLDHVIQLTAVERPDTDVSFNLSFGKARDRTPENRGDFEAVNIALLINAWACDRARKPEHEPKPPSPKAMSYFNALANAVAVGKMTFQGWPAATMDAWKAECVTMGLIDREAKDNSIRAQVSKYRAELVAAKKIACNGDHAWPI